MKFFFKILLLFITFSGVALGQSQTIDLSSLNAEKYIEYAPVLNRAGTYIVFQSNRNKGFKLYESFKHDTVWSIPNSIENINTYRAQDLSIIGSPYLSADGNVLIYNAWFSDTYGDLDLYYSVKKDNTWSKPEHFSNAINSVQPELSPSLSNEGDSLFFIRKVKTDVLTASCGKIFYSVKDVEGNWTVAKELMDNQSCYDRVLQTYAKGFFLSENNNKHQLVSNVFTKVDTDKEMSNYLSSLGKIKTPWLTPKEEALVYVSNGDIATVNLPYNTHIMGSSYIGKVKDEEKGLVVNEVTFLVQDSIGNTSFNFSNKENGDYALYVPAAYTYKVRITAPKYDTLYKYYKVEKDKMFSIIEEDILIKHRKTKMIFRVSDQDNGKNLRVKVKLTNKTTGEELVLDENMQQDGKYTVHLREGDEYAVEVNNVMGYAFTKQIVTATDSAVAISVERIKQGAFLEVHDIYFDFNSYKLSDDSYKELDKLAEWMKTNKKVFVRIEAHTDDVGSPEFNLNLSEKRAKEIVRYLTKKGVASSRMQAKGYGMSKPRVEGNTEEARAQNRRVELNVLNAEK